MKLERETENLFYVQASFFVIAKIVMELGFMYCLIPLDKDYSIDFNLEKYVVGWIWLIVLLSSSNLLKENTVSKFMIQMHIYISIMPIAIVFAFMNESSLFFSCVCAMYFIVILLCLISSQREIVLIKIKYMPNIILYGSIMAVMIVVLYAIVKNGFPSFMALDLNKVYQVRADAFITNKYIGYLYSIVNYSVIPFLMAYSIEKRRYLCSVVLIGIILLLYLYSGNKTSLFSILLLLGCIVAINFKKTTMTTMNLISIGTIGFTLLWVVEGIYAPYSLFVRRTLIFPSLIKFYHFDFFSHNFFLKFSGSPIGSLTGDNASAFGNLLFNESIPNAIGRIYFNAPEMGANTGFLVEGFSRFGYIGFFVTAIIFFLVLKLLDLLQKRAGYTIALVGSAYFIYSLNDLHLINSIIFGPGLYVVLVSMFFYSKRERGMKNEDV